MSEFKPLPEVWKSKPELIELANQHQVWLQEPVTQKLYHALIRERDRLSNLTASCAVTPSKSSEEVRIYAAQLNNVQQNIKLIYDTEKFIETITRPTS